MTLLLFLAALAGGALNAVAGGGSFVALPVMLYAGIAPVTANATATLAWWPASVSSAIAYRRDIRVATPVLVVFVALSIVGGILGALLLLRTSNARFMRLLPWLMLFAALAFTFGDRLVPRDETPTRGTGLVPALLQLAIATYGGYFGGGMGIMMLATLSIAGLRDIHEMNGLKSILGAAINGVALVEFVANRAVSWAPGLVMMAGAIAGGYGGAVLARRIDRRIVRRVVVAIAWIMTAYFFGAPRY